MVWEGRSVGSAARHREREPEPPPPDAAAVIARLGRAADGADAVIARLGRHDQAITTITGQLAALAGCGDAERFAGLAGKLEARLAMVLLELISDAAHHA